jgi:isocitrate lyase
MRSTSALFELAQGYRETGMTAYARLQEIEFEREAVSDYRAVRHQSFVGTGYFDAIAQAIAMQLATVRAQG